MGSLAELTNNPTLASRSLPNSVEKIKQAGLNYFQCSSDKYKNRQSRYPTEGSDNENLILLQGSLNFTLDNQAFSIPLTDQLSLDDIFHTESNQEIGLAPKPKKAPEETTWIKEKFAVLPVKAEGMLQTVWSSKYCKIATGLSIEDIDIPQLNFIILYK